MTGLLLGDARAHQKTDPRLWLVGGPAGQLACFTVEGMTRAWVRQVEKGICHPPSVVWHAFQRWGSIQGLLPTLDKGNSQPWPDGWLQQQAPLRQRRGNAPATAGALKNDSMGTPQRPVNASAGHHALSNCATLALTAGWQDLGELAIEVAALTHGDAGAQLAARDGAMLLFAATQANSSKVLDYRPSLSHEGPPGTAQHALRTAAQVTADVSGPGDFLDAIAAADGAGGRGAATFTGAILGAAYGISRLPQEHIRRLELGIIAESLARDAVETISVPNAKLDDRYWWNRYPGW